VPILARIKEEFSFVRGNYLLLVLSWILMDFALELPAIFYGPYVLYDLQGTPFILGLIGFISLIVQALVQFPGGYLADKHGRKWLVSTMTIGVGIAYIFYALASTWHWILIGAVVASFCLIYQPALWALTADSTTSEKRGMGFSIITLINNVATTPAPIIIGIIVSLFTRSTGMRIAYTITVLGFFVAAAFRSRLKETKQDPQKIEFKDFFRNYPQAVKESFSVWKTLPRSVAYLFLVNVITMFALSVSGLYFSVYVVEGKDSVLHVSQTDWALVNTVLFVSMILVAIPIGKFIDRFGRKTPFSLSFLVFAPVILMFIQANVLMLFLVFPLMGLAQILFYSSFSTLQMDYVPTEKRGKIVGSSNFVNYIISAVGQLIGGIMYEISPQLPFLTVLPLLVSGFVITILLISEPKQRQK
jgi:DHA1 family multidrug resistance protein B-like MFS transporter